MKRDTPQASFTKTRPYGRSNNKKYNNKGRSKPQQILQTDEELEQRQQIKQKIVPQETKSESVPTKEVTMQKRTTIDELLREDSLFAPLHKTNNREQFMNERIIATDNYSTHPLAIAAANEYKYMTDLVPAKARVFAENWSCADHVFMRTQQLQMYLATQDELQALAPDEPSIWNLYHEEGIDQREQVINDLEDLPATNEMLKVFMNYMPTKDKNNNTQMFLPYRYRHQNQNIIGLAGNNLSYDITNNAGMVDAVAYVKDAESNHWAHFALHDDERVRRYDPMAVQQFLYQQTRTTQQMQGGPPPPGTVSFQMNYFDTEGFNRLFGCFLLNYNYNGQRMSNTMNRFNHQRLHHGVFFYDQVMRFRQVLAMFPEINMRMIKMSFRRSDLGIIRREPFRPVIWGLKPNNEDEAVFVVQGNTTQHVMSPFMFYNHHDAQAWGGFYLRVGQVTYGFGDINLYVSENIGSTRYAIHPRTTFMRGLEMIFKKKVDTVFTPLIQGAM